MLTTKCIIAYICRLEYFLTACILCRSDQITHNFSALLQKQISSQGEATQPYEWRGERRLCAERRLKFFSHNLLLNYPQQVLVHGVLHFILNVVRNKYRCTVWSLNKFVYFRRQHQCEEQPCCVLLWQTMSRLVHRMAPTHNPFNNIAELGSQRHVQRIAS